MYVYSSHFVLNNATKIVFFIFMIKNIPFPFAFVIENSYIANIFKTLTNQLGSGVDDTGKDCR